eukprot:5125353-Pleurochrysis_carterae.AAC.1
MQTNRELLQRLLIYRLLLQSHFDNYEGVDIEERLGEMPTPQQTPGCGDRAWNWKLKLAGRWDRKLAAVSSRVPPCDGESRKG